MTGINATDNSVNVSADPDGSLEEEDAEIAL
jgi:hypothetical protein